MHRAVRVRVRVRFRDLHAAIVVVVTAGDHNDELEAIAELGLQSGIKVLLGLGLQSGIHGSLRETWLRVIEG